MDLDALIIRAMVKVEARLREEPERRDGGFGNPDHARLINLALVLTGWRQRKLAREIGSSDATLCAALRMRRKLPEEPLGRLVALVEERIR